MPISKYQPDSWHDLNVSTVYLCSVVNVEKSLKKIHGIVKTFLTMAQLSSDKHVISILYIYIYIYIYEREVLNEIQLYRDRKTVSKIRLIWFSIRIASSKWIYYSTKMKSTYEKREKCTKIKSNRIIISITQWLTSWTVTSL